MLHGSTKLWNIKIISRRSKKIMNETQGKEI